MQIRVVFAVCSVGAFLVLANPGTAEYRETTVSNGGSVSGRVRLSGEVPSLPPQPVFKHQEVCGSSMPDERLLVGKDGSVQNAVVHLVGIEAGKPIPRDVTAKLDNLKCAFVPHVSSATVGQMLEIRNSDPFLHDAHAQLGSRTLFNVAIPKGRVVRKPLAYAGVVHLNCNVRHTWMHAYLFVAEHPYHAVTDAAGRFKIEAVPPGKYTLAVWHEMLGSSERATTVRVGSTTSLEIELPPAAPEVQ
jgi:hypothetical protein